MQQYNNAIHYNKTQWKRQQDTVNTENIKIKITYI